MPHSFIFYILLMVSFTWVSAEPTTIISSTTTTPMTNVFRQNFNSEKKNHSDQQWSLWSDWSPCSRTCDGGATYQTRQCLNSKYGCVGENIRYKICNIQPCLEIMDFRLHQCQSFNSVPYQGKLYSWIPHNDPISPCALYCKAVNFTLVVQLAPRVHDGTRCKEGSLDMCIDGLCQPVGCDLQLSSDLKIDVCGVCGGDGSSCSDPLYQWEYSSQLGPCSASCGGGEQEVQSICKNVVTKEEISEHLCDETTRPAGKFLPCNQEPCPPIWTIESWGPCSKSCGEGGIKSRRVFCSQGNNVSQVNDSLCLAVIGEKPREQEPCNIHDCPRWFEGPWSECSVTCGYGLKTRTVICRDARGHVTDACDLNNKPEASQPCSVDLQCPLTTVTTLSTLPNRPTRQKATPFHLFDDTEEVDEKDLKSASINRMEVLPPVASVPRPSALLSGKLLVDESSLALTDPTFIPGEWSPCSVTCGEGTREREVHCKIYLEFSRTIAKLPNEACPGPKPHTTEPCFMTPCSLSNKFEPWVGEFSDQSNRNKEVNRLIPENLRNVIKSELISSRKPNNITYRWKLSGYTQCSASCLGGVQESIIECIRDHDGERVSPYLCPIEKRPDSITRTCNDIPCPPRWNISDFSPCSKSCGGGIQSRDVHCIHEVARGGRNTLPVTSDLCPQPPPRAQQLCNMIDCLPEWNVGPWSKCSSKCGKGYRIRKITCQQELALGDILPRSPQHCMKPKPIESKPCNPKSCDDMDKPKILAVNQTFVQNIFKKKVTLKIGGKATVYKGTQVKIRCPIKHFNKTRIVWMKDHEVLIKSKRHEQNNKGMLRIQDITYSDSGVYSCVAGKSIANITLTVRPSFGPNSISSESDLTGVHYQVDESTDIKGSNDRKGKQPGHPNLEKWPTLPVTSDDDKEPDSLNEINENSLDSSRHGKPTFDLKQGKPRPLETWGRTTELEHEDDTDFSRPLYSDQEMLIWPFQKQQQQHQQQQQTVQHFATDVANDQGTKGRNRRPKVKASSAAHSGLSVKTAKSESVPSYFDIDNATGTSVILGKGKAEQLKFEWLLTPWSKCSQTCGGSGFQVRAAQCIVRLNNVTKSVEGSLCEDAGLDTPTTMQKCGLDSCPHWETGSWTPCEESQCFTWNTALQKRNVHCRMDNGTDLDPILCSEQDKPSQKRECFNDNCRGTWKVGDWSECTASCGSQGHRSRLLHCVWYGTDIAAGLACHDLTRPAVIRNCYGPPCPARGECKDASNYCSLARVLKLCYIPQYQQHCCQTCKTDLHHVQQANHQQKQ